MRVVTFTSTSGNAQIEDIFNALERLFAERCELQDGEFISMITFEKGNEYLVRVAIDKDSPSFEEFLAKSVEFIIGKS